MIRNVSSNGGMLPLTGAAILATPGSGRAHGGGHFGATHFGGYHGGLYRSGSELTDAAYGFVLRNRFMGTFVEAGLGLWDALRASVEDQRVRVAFTPDRTILRSAPFGSNTNTIGD